MQIKAVITALGRRTFPLVLLAAGMIALQVSSCGSARRASNQKNAEVVNVRIPAPPTPPAPPLEEVAFSDSTGVLGIVSFLASDALKGRDTGSEGIEQAAQFLETRLQQYGMKPYFTSYRDTLTNSKTPAYNVVGYIPGSDPELADEYILIGAHYDHIGIVPIRNGDGIANGANDNASGTATVLELARYFGANGAPRRSLIFAFFSAEERGLLGSKHLAQRLKEADLDLYAMMNFEMTGVPMMAKDYLVYLTGYHKSNMADVANRYGGDSLVGYLPQAADYNLFQRSDNYSFFQEYQIPAHTFSTFDFENYPFYHLPGDEAGAMDYSHMAEVANRIIPAVHGIANGPKGELKLK